MPKVSVIIPIYNVEKYIEKCLISLFEQTLDDIEYIFVNDCTPDKSMQILEDVLKRYPKRQNQVKIINHVLNQGQAGARTSGMKAMTGEYMIHCDPDDWIDTDMYETMYNYAIEQNIDIVCCNWIIESNKDSIKQKFDYGATPQDSLKRCLYNPSLWNKLIKTDLIKNNNIYPYEEINCGEDLNVVIRTLYYAKTLKSLNIYPYHYRINQKSITQNNHKILFFNSHKPNVEKLCQFLEDKGSEYNILQNYIKFIEKYGLISKSCNDFKLWSKTWPECHKFIKYFPMPSRYKRITSICANYPYLLKLYYNYLRWRTSQKRI